MIESYMTQPAGGFTSIVLTLFTIDLLPDIGLMANLFFYTKHITITTKTIN